MTYNLTNLTGSTGAVDIFKYANDSSNGVLFGFFVIAIFFVLLMGLKRYSFENGLLVASWISFLISAVMTYAKFLSIIYPLFFLILAALTSLYVFMVTR